MPTFKAYNQGQSMLLPPTLSECLPTNHFAFVVNEVVNNLNLISLTNTYAKEGSPAYDPRLMIKILFYGYAKGITSSRRLERATYEDIAFRYLAANSQPDHGTINLFRKNHLGRLDDIFSQVVFLCNRLGMIDMSDISIDGTKIKASASRQNLFTQEQITKLKEKIGQSLRDAIAEDEREDALYGDKSGYPEIPEALLDPEKRRQAIKDELEKIRLEKLDEAEKKIKAKLAKCKTKKAKQKSKNNTSNTTDPDSNLMKMKDGSYKMGYNIQISSSRQVITGFDVNSEPTDARQLKNMIELTENTTNQKVKIVKADSAYFSKHDLQFCQEHEIDAYVPDREKAKDEKQEKNNTVSQYDRSKFTYNEELDQFICPSGQLLVFSNLDARRGKKYICKNCQNCPVKSQCTKGKQRCLYYDAELEKLTNEMRTKLNSEVGKKKYNERISEVEPVFGNLKHNRGFTKFQTRGKPMVTIETGLYAIAHNLIKIFNYQPDSVKNNPNEQFNILTRLQAVA